MSTIEAIKYIAIHVVIGGVLGFLNAVWLEWLWWERGKGPNDDHSYDYIAMVIWGIGALLGAVAGGWMAYGILRGWDKLPR
jgi:hypothetical protein